jgi:hypothetical protein
MENAIFGFIGALIGAIFGFIGSVLSTFGKSKDTSKEVLTRTVTDERAQWRKDLREVSGDFVENALRIANNESTGSVYSLEKQRVLIRLRLNPDPSHTLDANILLAIESVVIQANAKNLVSLKSALEEFERSTQAILKQEWEKSKKEAESGALEIQRNAGET